MAQKRDAALPSIEEFRPATLRGMPGYVRVGQTRGGQWWLIDPEGRPFFSKAVAGVSRTGWAEGRSSRPGKYAAAVDALYGHEDPERFVRSATQRLRKWNVNTLGAWTGADFFDQGTYYAELIEFRKVGPSFHSGSARLPDVFDPAWRDAADSWAKQICAPRKSSTQLVGYFTDHELGWAQPHPEHANGVVPADPKGEGPSLLQICLSLEPSFRAYHAAWEFVLAPRNGDIESLAADWGLPLQNREGIRQLTLAEKPLVSAGYLRDQRRFAREFARRYFTTCSAVIRAYDSNHLILGCRFAEFPGSSVLAECIHPSVDVASIRPEREGWDRTAQTCFSANGMPVLLTDLSWADTAFARVPMKREVRRLTSVERMLSKARTYLERVCAHRAVVGYEWSRWVDAEEEEPPFASGLVHTDDREAREHTELLAEFNARAEILRLKAK